MVSMKYVAPIGALLRSVAAAPATYPGSDSTTPEVSTAPTPSYSRFPGPGQSGGPATPSYITTAESDPVPSSEPSGNPDSDGCAPGAGPGSKHYSLKDIESSKDLKWVPCYGKFTCARLSVPNDYSNPNNGAMASIPLIRSAATKVSASGKPQMVLLNPGGPGGSGVELILGSASELAQLMPEWDLVSWDPRGIGFSIPSANCVDDITAMAGAYSAGLVGSPGATNESLYEMVALAKAQSQACEMALEGDKGAGQFMSTSTVARDMISITDAYNKACGQPEGGLVNFVGYSYGTVLGQYFASMFPDRVGRFILDGVVDVDDWVTGTFEKGTLTSDGAVDKFFSDCYEAGPEKCTLYEKGGAKAVGQKVYDFLHKLDKEPVSGVLQGPPNMPRVPVIVTSDIFKSLMFLGLYQPQGIWPTFAQAISDSMNGKPELLLTLTAKLVDVPVNATGGSSAWDLPYAHMGEWLTGVTCSDIYPANINLTAEDFMEYEAKAVKQSFWGGEGITNNKIGCVGWGFDGKGKFKGKFGGKTKTPILFIGNSLDPITPQINAITGAKKFEGAEALKNDGPGHCSLSAPSDCINKAYARYMSTGKIPDISKGCKTTNAFEAPPQGGPQQSKVSDPNEKSDGRTKQSAAGYINAINRPRGPMHR